MGGGERESQYVSSGRSFARSHQHDSSDVRGVGGRGFGMGVGMRARKKNTPNGEATGRGLILKEGRNECNNDANRPQLSQQLEQPTTARNICSTPAGQDRPTRREQ